MSELFAVSQSVSQSVRRSAHVHPRASQPASQSVRRTAALFLCTYTTTTTTNNNNDDDDDNDDNDDDDDDDDDDYNSDGDDDEVQQLRQSCSPPLHFCIGWGSFVGSIIDSFFCWRV